MMKEAITWQKQKQVPVIYSHFIPFLTTNLYRNLSISPSWNDIIVGCARKCYKDRYGNNK
jgi:hypothetical protein